jgi:thiamine-phosphate pyrophosphorylase
MSANQIGAGRRARLAAARLYLVCDCQPGGRRLTDVLRATIAGGVDIVQLREKRLPDDELTDIAHTAHKICEQLGALLIVNDRPHIALAAGADGVHVGQDDMPVAQVRALVGTELLIGLSTHTPAEIDAAGSLGGAGETGGAAMSRWSSSATPPDIAGAPAAPERPRSSDFDVDYIGVGPVYPTPTKPGRPAVGLELVRYATTHARLPFFAIGGIDERNLSEAIEAGAQRVAVVRALADAADPESAARALRMSLDAHPMKDALARAALTR